MTHTNTIEALTLELDRVNEQKRVMLGALKDIISEHDNTYDGEPMSSEKYFSLERARKAIQKAESR